jgi:hypothetical protein
MKYRSIVILLAMALLWTGMGIVFPAGLEAAEGRGKGAGELPRELKGVRVRGAFIPSAGKPAGVVQSVVGHVVVAREGMREAYYSAAGDRLYERDTLFTLKGSRCRFRLNGEDVVTMGEGTKISISAFSVDKARGTKSSALKMSNGKAMFYAMKLFRYKGAAMTVETGTAVVGVRGTKWGVEIIEPDEKPTASRPLLVADLSDTGFRHLAQLSRPNIQTNVYTFEGQIQITSTITGQTTTLSGGQGLNAGVTGLGAPFQTPPGVAQQFNADTSAPGGNSGTSSSGTTTTGSTTATGNGGGTTATPETSTVAQDQTTNDASKNTPSESKSHYGYFAGMLFNDCDGPCFRNFSVSTTMQNFQSTAISGEDPFSGEHSVTADGSSDYLNPTLKTVTVIIGATPTTWTGSRTITHTGIGSNEYMEWGSWIQADPMVIGYGNYAYDTKGLDSYDRNTRGYYVHGTNTSDAQMAALKAADVTATYSGSAYGTYWKYNRGGGVDMTGTFSADVNFNPVEAYPITNFNMSVQNSSLGKSVSITGASGSFTGSSSQFNLTGGTVAITDGSYATHKTYGSVYGPNGEAIGGVWAVQGGGPCAVGMFQGTKQQ